MLRRECRCGERLHRRPILKHKQQPRPTQACGFATAHCGKALPYRRGLDLAARGYDSARCDRGAALAVNSLDIFTERLSLSAMCGKAIAGHTSIHAVGSFGNDRVISVSQANNGARSCSAVSAVIFAR